METIVEQSEGKALVKLEGHLDSYKAEEVEKLMAPLYTLEDTEITLDCTDLEYISSSGLRLFLTLRKEAAAKGGKVIIEHISEDIKKVFMMTGFYNLFEIR